MAIGEAGSGGGVSVKEGRAGLCDVEALAASETHTHTHTHTHVELLMIPLVGNNVVFHSFSTLRVFISYTE